MATINNGAVNANDTGETVNLYDQPYTNFSDLNGGNGNDILRGNSTNNRIVGGSGNDQLWGGAGGDDTLIGGVGIDAYWWGRNDGIDFISSSLDNSQDALLAYSVNLGEYSGGNDNGNLYFQTSDGSKIVIADWYSSSSNNRIQSFVFANNVAYAWNNGSGAEVNLYNSIYEDDNVRHLASVDSGNCTLRGGSGNDIIEGGTGNDHLWGGGGGADTLAGGAGNDTYWWGRNDGNDVISYNSLNSNDTIQLYDVARSQLTVTRSNNDCILRAGSSTLTIQNWASSSLQNLVFSDGTTASINSLLSPSSNTRSNYAVIIGIGDYPGTLNDLNGPFWDKADVSSFLNNSSLWQDTDITSLWDPFATRSSIISRISSLASQVDEADNVLIFYSGHGLASGDLVPYDYSSAGGINPAQMYSLLSPIANKIGSSGHITLMVDACYSGTFANYFRNVGAGSQYTVFSSSDANELSYEAKYDGLFYNGKFTYYCVENGLRYRQGDTNHDGQIGSMELYNYLYTTNLVSNQHSQIYDGSNGSYIIA